MRTAASVLLIGMMMAGCSGPTTGPDASPLVTRLTEDQNALLENGVVPVWAVLRFDQKPGEVYARRYDITKKHGILPSPVWLWAKSVEEIREMLPKGLKLVVRTADSPERLIETWYSPG